MNSFKEQFTAITFTNQDQDKLTVKHSDDDEDIIEIHLSGEVFWCNKEDGEKLANGILKMCE